MYGWERRYPVKKLIIFESSNVGLNTVFAKHRGVAQPGRVLRSGRRSRRFESSRPDQNSKKVFINQ